MVQVDVFWSFGIGAGLGLASFREKRKTTESPRLRDALMYLATIFAPSGFVLLWCFPSWETMHVGTREMPGWLVALFGVTNITQGVLGFWAARRLAEAGRPYGSYLLWLAGYFGMFFILIHGWDGSGYQRFLSPTREAFDAWTWDTAARWLTSDVAITLGVMGVFVVPPLVGWTTSWLREGFTAAQRAALNPVRQGAMVLLLLTVVLPVVTIGSSVLVRRLGWLGGIPANAALGWLLLREGGALHRYFRVLVHAESFFARQPAGAAAPSLTPAREIAR